MIVEATTADAAKLFLEGQQAFARMEHNGMRIDETYLDKMIEKTKNTANELKRELENDSVFATWKKTFGNKTKLDSPDQLGKVLFDVLKYPSPGRTLSGEGHSTTEEALESVDNPFAKKYVRRRKLEKLLGTYLYGIKFEIVDGFVHPSFNLNLVISYRSSANMPNVQNVINRQPESAKILRSCFIPRKKGNYLVEIDYSAFEVCGNACYSQDPILIDYIVHAKDMHKNAAMEIFLIDDWDSVPVATEKNPKNKWSIRYFGKNGFVFPEFYGSVYFQCAPILWEAMANLTGPNGVPMREHLKSKGVKKLGKCDPQGEALPGTFERTVKNWERKFWGPQYFRQHDQWRKDWYAAYRRDGGFHTKTGFHIRGMFKRNEVINLPCQGSCFHCVLWSQIQLQKRLDKNKMKSKIINEVHDSILADVPANEMQDFISMAKEIMTQEIRKAWPWIIVPLEVEVECSDQNWHSKKEWKRNERGIWAQAV